MMKRILAIALLVAACEKPAPDSAPVRVAAATPVQAAPVSARTIKVYKDANCGCCKEWIRHLEQNGFTVEAMDMPDLSAVKAKYGVRENLQACHTAVIGNYVVEGHVPADLIVKMIEEKPAIAGIAVPGMPSGSPGMEGGAKQPYDVLAFDSTGHTTVYAKR